MCVIGIVNYKDQAVSRVIVHNRDEFYARAATSLTEWSPGSQIVSGVDQESGGTWIGMTRSGRFVAVLNQRLPTPNNAKTRSRGILSKDFLQGRESSETYIAQIRARREQFAHFTLLLSDAFDAPIHIFSSSENLVEQHERGALVLSNGTLASAWPKQQRLNEALKGLRTDTPTQAMFKVLQDTSRPSDENLPLTGLSLEQERLVSPIFVQSATYGTRCSTVIKIHRLGTVEIAERTFHLTSPPEDRQYAWNTHDYHGEQGYNAPSFNATNRNGF